MSQNSAQRAMGTIDEFIRAVSNGSEKRAASPISEPGSVGGETQHQIKKVDDGLEVPKEGDRSKENTADVKKDQGAAGIDSQPEKAASIFGLASRFAKVAANSGGTAEDDQLQIGTKKAPTGEDPKSETASAKAGKQDSPSTHPARTDNDELDGHKYASTDPLEKLAAMTQEIGNALCSQIAWLNQQSGQQQKTASQPVAQPQVQTKVATIDPELAQQAGWELAGLLNGTLDKQAAEAMVQSTLEQITKTASDDADAVIWYIQKRLEKTAEPGLPPEMAGGDPPGGAPGGEAEMMAALGGAGAPGEPPPGGGAPGGMPGEMPGGAGGEGGEMSPDQLMQILEQLGVTPEELQEALAQEMGGGGGGAPPGGAPPEMAGAAGGAPPEMAGKTAADKHAKAGFDKQALAITNMIREVVTRSRTKK